MENIHIGNEKYCSVSFILHLQAFTARFLQL